MHQLRKRVIFFDVQTQGKHYPREIREMVRTFVSKRRRRYISHLQLDSPLQKLRAQAVFETFDLSLGRVLGAAAGTLIPPDALF